MRDTHFFKRIADYMKPKLLVERNDEFPGVEDNFVDPFVTSTGNRKLHQCLSDSPTLLRLDDDDLADLP